MPRGSIRVIARSVIGLIALVLFYADADAEDGGVATISPALCEGMKSHNVMRPISPVGCDRLRLVTFPYYGFDGRVHSDGQIVVMDAAANSVLQVFLKLRQMQFPIAKARLMDHYKGNDSASTADNNTSSFNARQSTGGSSLSMHAFGLAIDLNPVQNPYVMGRRVAPASAAAYADRVLVRPGMAESVIDAFAEQGFTVWGGTWRNPIDYQHFQVPRPMAERLAGMSSAQAVIAFKRYVDRIRACRRNAAPSAPQSQCIDAR